MIKRTDDGLVVDRVGRVLFVPIKDDYTEDYANAIETVGTINTITVTNTVTKTDIPDGNGMFPVGSRITEIAGTVAIEFNTIDEQVWGMATGSGLKENTSDTMIKILDAIKISDAATIEIPYKYKANGLIKIVGADGTVYEKAEADPAGAGEYKISEPVSGKTTITFNAADAGKAVSITIMVEQSTYYYTLGTNTMANHKIIIDTTYSDVANKTKRDVNLVISQASLSADLTETLQKDPTATKTLTFNMYKPLPGEEPYTVKISAPPVVGG